MNEQVRRVLRGFTKLSTPEQQEFVRSLNAFVRGDVERTVLLEDLYKAERMELGPISSGCPCCGK